MDTYGKRKRDLTEAEDNFMKASAKQTEIRRRYKKEDRQFVGEPDYEEAADEAMKAFEELERVRRRYGVRPL